MPEQNNDNIRHPKPPTEKDLKILKWMDEGNRIDNAKAQTIFKCRGLRDVIYRLRCAGHIIKHKDISYEDEKEKQTICYRQWFTKEIEIISAGQKIERSLKGNSVADVSRNINKISKQTETNKQNFAKLF